VGIDQATLIAGEGCILTCPECRARIGTLVKPLYQQMTFGLDAIRFFAGQKPRQGSAHCNQCGGCYAELDSTPRSQTMLIHTDHGWIPKPPPNVKPPPRPTMRRKQ